MRLPKAMCFVLLAMAMLLPQTGCGPRSVPIQGTVTLDGAPLEGVQILFDQPEAKVGNSFSGKTDGDGRFVLKLVSEEISTPVAGEYRVTLTTAVADRDALENTPLPKERIPKQYRNGVLTFDLPDGGTLDAEFALKSK